MLEAYRFGVPEGLHRQPWAPDYHREAVHVYGESLPWTYQRDIARLFRDSESAIAGVLISAELAEDWAIVVAYMREAAGSIEDWLASGEPASRRSAPARSPELEEGPPRVVHYDGLARLTTRAGVLRLKLAADAVRQHLDADAPASLAAAEQTMLKRLASGVPIADLAVELGFSERSMYREMSRLWDKLGVPDRATGLLKAAAEGLID